MNRTSIKLAVASHSKPAEHDMLANPLISTMKALLGTALGISISTCGICEAQSLTGQPVETAIPVSTSYAITTQNANSRVWQSTDYQQSPTGGVITNIHSYTEMASGLNHLVNGQWVESSDQIDILPNGTAVATNGQHQAYFPGDIYQGQIELVTSEGLQLNSRPLALSYFDGTNTVVIAELTNSIGIVVGTDQVVYPSAFNGIAADLQYIYTKSGFSQDIVIKQQPPTPESLGLNPDTARLQIMTEFFSPPQPSIQSTTLPAQAGLSLTDESLGFGSMQMIQGRAFLLGQNASDAGALVSKHWLMVDGRQILVEEVPVDAILEGLAALPLTAMNTSSSKNSHTASKHLKLPPRRLAQDTSTTTMLSKADLPTQGFVLDYQTVTGTFTNYTFQGDTTYYISSALTLFGTNTFEGGAVIKYTNNAAITISPGPVGSPSITWKGAAYRPVVFTAINDNTIGDSISGSTGNPTNYYGNPMLSLVGLSPTPTLTGLRMSYAKTAMTFSGASINIYGAQFVNCQYGFSGAGATVNLRNALSANLSTNCVATGGVTINAQNVTFSGSGCLFASPSSPSGCSLILSNCIFANLTNLTVGSTTASGGYNGFYNTTNFGSTTFTNTFYPFQTVGAGNYYLTNGCGFTNKGSLSIDPTLLASLKQKTTYPPMIYSNRIITVTNLSLQALRDTNVLNVDLGYHYDPLDYLVGGSDIYSNLTVSAGTAIAWFSSVGSIPSSSQGYGFSLEKGGNFTFQGTVTAPSWMVSYHTVQEGYLTPVGYFGGIMPSTSGSGAIPQLNATFTKWSVLPADGNNFRDNYANGTATFADCEFYIGGLNPYDMSSVIFTNCLFYRNPIYYFSYLSLNAQNTIFENCTFYNGFLALNRYSSQPATTWIIQNTAFDGTGFSIGDNYNGNTNNTKFDYNAYNTNNNSGLGYSYPYTPPPTNRLENIGPHDQFVGTYNWQSSWFGNFYQPTNNSQLIDMGSTNANYLGLYQFTTQTNQVKETNSIVNIGYHYVAADTNGVPLDTNGDGIPDYLEDANGNGLVDNGETPWCLAISEQPVSVLANQGSNAVFIMTAAGIAPFNYQWYFNSNQVAYATNATLTLNNVQTNNAGMYFVIVSNSLASVVSYNATLGVVVLPTITITNPINNSIFAASSTNVTLGATATDTAGNIQVQFFQGTNNLGSVSSPPYSLVWSNATTGNYSLTAVATDNGLSATSQVVNITVTPLLTTNNLLIWLKADAIMGLTNNALVGTWPDSSGWNHNATSADTNTQPLYVTNVLNQLPVVRFNGISNWIYMPFSLGQTVGLEAFVVLKVFTNQPGDNQALWRMGQNETAFVGYPDRNGDIVDDFGSFSAYNLGMPVQQLTKYHMYDVTGSSIGWAAWVNGQLLLNSSGNAYVYGNYTTGYFIGFDSAGLALQRNAWKGDIAEVIFFNRTLSTQERDIVGTYLWSKYNLVQFATNAVPPAAPVNFVAVAQAPYNLNLQWASASTNATSFHIDRTFGTGGLFQDIGAVSLGVTNFLDTTVVPTNQYVYRVRAHNLFGDVSSTVISPPVASVNLISTNGYVLMGVTNLLVAQASDAYSTINQIQLIDDYSTNNVIGTGSSTPYTNSWIAGFTTMYTISALAKDALGNSRYSAPISVTSYLDSNGDGIPDFLQVWQGNDPINPWMPPLLNTNDHTAPIITLLIPTNAITIP